MAVLGSTEKIETSNFLSPRTLLRAETKLQVNTFQKVLFVHLFIEKFEQNFYMAVPLKMINLYIP